CWSSTRTIFSRVAASSPSPTSCAWSAATASRHDPQRHRAQVVEVGDDLVAGRDRHLDDVARDDDLARTHPLARGSEDASRRRQAPHELGPLRRRSHVARLAVDDEPRLDLVREARLKLTERDGAVEDVAGDRVLGSLAPGEVDDLERRAEAADRGDDRVVVGAWV